MSATAVFQMLPELKPRNSSQGNAAEIVGAAQDVLLQGLGLLFELGNHTYSHVAREPFNASIGQHYRHVLEHFQSLVIGMRATEINYDARERNPRTQTEVTYASIATCDILRALKRCANEALTRDCTVINSVGYSTTGPSSFSSNISRELAYCAGHAIHHYAIIRLIGHEIGVPVPVEFGVAPSTLRHMKSLVAD